MNSADIPPNQTIYVNNLNEKVKKQELRKSLYALFTQYGPILSVVALKTDRMRGQAFIVFKDISSATSALRGLQNFPFYDKPIRLQYAKSKSDAVSQLDGTYQPRDKTQKREKPEKRKAVDTSDKERATKKPAPTPAETNSQEADTEAAVAASSAAAANAAQAARNTNTTPNKILFVENLPDECTALMLKMLFQQFPGYVDIRMVPGPPVSAFVEYENELEASVAMRSLQHFKITSENLMQISYARR